jgi:hypothetical protein
MKEVKAFPGLHVLLIYSTRYCASVTVKAVARFGFGYRVSVLDMYVQEHFATFEDNLPKYKPYGKTNLDFKIIKCKNI